MMSNWLKRISLIVLIIFALGITGCLSSGGGQMGQKQDVAKDDPIVEDQNEEIAEDSTTPFKAYNPNGNKKPLITYFGTDDIDEAIVEKGQVISFKATAMDPEGVLATVRYEATGGTINGNKWTAPNVGGIYQVKAIASDGVLESDPEIISLKVPGLEGGLDILNIGVVGSSTTATNGQKRAINSASTDLTDNAIVEVGESVDIQLTYTSDDTVAVAPEFSVGTNAGSIIVKDWDDDGASDTFTHTYTYTASSTAPTGNKVTLTFNILNTENPGESATASILLIVNTPPTISSVKFTDSAETSIEPSATKTIKVNAVEEDEGDTLTYFYEIYDGAGSLAEATNATSEVDYTAGSSTGTEKVLVIVTDSRGGSAQEVFTIINVNPMNLVVADGAATDYSDATTDDGSVEPEYRVLTTSEAGTEVQAPVAADHDLMVALRDGGIEAFTSNVPAGAGVTYEWTDTVNVGTAKTASETYATNPTTTETVNWYPSYPGQHTIAVKATARTSEGTVTQNASDTIYVNEPPRITGVSFTNSNGETASLFNGASQSTIQVAPGQKMTLTVAVNDADNERVTPENDILGYFADTATKFTAKLLENNVGDGDPATDDYELEDDISGQARINSGNGYTNTTTIGKTSMAIDYEVYQQATSGTGTYQYIVIRASDGMDDVSDGSAPAPLTIDEVLDANVKPGISGISKAFDSENDGATGLIADDAGTKIGYHPRKTNFDGRFYLEYVDTDSDNVGDTWKIYDEINSAYIQDEDGDDITILNTAGNGALGVVDALPAPYDWLLVDINGVVPVLEDKVYFRTFATQVVAKFEVINGPRITTVIYNQFITLGESMEIKVYGDNGEDTSYISMNLLTDEGGLLEQGTDTDGDLVDFEVWNYQAPTSWPADDDREVRVMVTLTDYNDNSLKLSKEIMFKLNRKPVIGDLNATSKVDTTDGFWTKKGVRNIPLSAVVNDPDTADYGDTFNYIWSIVGDDSGSMDFDTSNSARWDPMNGSTPLTATGGPNGNGQYPIQLTVIDKEDGLPKGGIAVKTMSIGINEDPTLTSLDMDTDKVAATVNDHIPTISEGDLWTEAKGTPWSEPDALTQANTGNVLINFDAFPQYPGINAFAYPVGVDDQADDRNDLTYMYYMTIGSSIGAPLTSEAFEYITHTDAVTELTTKALKWSPSLDMRKNGGTYYLHLRVEDPKYGAAKGILSGDPATIKIEITKDSTVDVADVNPSHTDKGAGQTNSVTVYNTNLANGNIYQGEAPDTPVYLKSGSKIKFSIPVDGTELPEDTAEVYVNIDGLVDGIYDTATPVYDPVLIALTRDDQGDQDPTNDRFVGEWIAPVANVDTANGVAHGAAPFIGFKNFRVVDLAGNVTDDNDATNGDLGTQDLGGDYADIDQIEADYDPPVIGDITNETTRAINGDPAVVVTSASTLNGITGLDMGAGSGINSTVMKIGDAVDFIVSLTDNMGDAAALDDETTAAIAYISSLVGDNPVDQDEDSYANNTLVNAWISSEDALSLDTSGATDGASTASIDDQDDDDDLVLAENSTVSVWGGDTYNIWIKATDNALAATLENTWPSNDQAMGNVHYTSKNFVTGANTGIDLKRPTLMSVDIYSYDSTVEEGEIGYAPFENAAGTEDRTAANDKTAFQYIDYTLFGNDVDAAKAELDDGNPDTAEIVRIKFDEPLLVNAGAENDALISTLNDYSVKLYKYRDDDGALKDDVSIGAVSATVGGGHDMAELDAMKNWAYTETANGDATDTSTVYIVLQSKPITSATIAVAATDTTITGTGTSFKDGVLSTGDIVEVYDSNVLATTTYAYEIKSIVSDTELTVEAVDGVGTSGVGFAAAGANKISLAVNRASLGSQFEVILADYKSDAAFGDGTNDGNEPLIILTDQHGNAINASQNNFTKDNPAVSW